MKNIAIITPYDYWWNHFSAKVVSDIYTKHGRIIPFKELNRRSFKLSDGTHVRWLTPNNLECELCGWRLTDVIIADCKLTDEQLMYINCCFFASNYE